MSTTLEAVPPASSSTTSLRHASVWKRYSFAWVTGALFLVSLAGHWWLAWHAYLDEQALHGASVDVSGFLIETGRDTLENWQSEFLQLVWQVAGLAFLFHVGSTQSREGNDRMEGKIDALLRAVKPEEADRIIAKLDERFDRS